MEFSEELYIRSRKGETSKFLVTSSSIKPLKDSTKPGALLKSGEMLHPYNKEGKLLSLFLSCVKFVAKNLHLLESLQGFPGDIAKVIWQTAIEEKCQISVDSLDIFCGAYPDEFMPRINICDIRLLDKFELDIGVLLRHSTEIDLSGCPLGDGHDLLCEFYSFPMLKSLNLSKCEITDKGMRTLFLPMFGFPSLEYLDISRNKICSKSLMRLGKLEKLKLFVISCEEKNLAEMDKSLKLTFRRRRPELKMFKNQGWAIKLLQKWEETLKVKAQKKKIDDFYGREIAKKKFVAQKFSNNVYMYERLYTTAENNASTKNASFQILESDYGSDHCDKKYDDDLLKMYR